MYRKYAYGFLLRTICQFKICTTVGTKYNSVNFAYPIRYALCDVTN